MGELFQPLHKATVNGTRLRFFAPPHGEPDTPWHAIDDLFRCLNLNRQQQKRMQRGFASEVFRTVPTTDGIVTLSPARST